jgi:hypothetical protein
LLGDDDGGRWFHPYGPRDRFGRATLATFATFLGRTDWTFEPRDLHEQASWWLGQSNGQGLGKVESRHFRDCGLFIWQSGTQQVIFDTGGFGPGRAGHSHSDALSLTARSNGRVILTDSGTFTYVGDPVWRDRFRGSAAHSTIRIGGRDQATAMGPFWWGDPGTVELRAITDDQIDAQCAYAGFVHRRMVRFEEPGIVLILDEVTGPAGQHTIEQFWQLASPEGRVHLHVAPDAVACEGWESAVFGEKHPIPSLVVRRRTALPAQIAAAIDLTGNLPVSIRELPAGAAFAWPGGTAELLLR